MPSAGFGEVDSALAEPSLPAQLSVVRAQVVNAQVVRNRNVATKRSEVDERAAVREVDAGAGISRAADESEETNDVVLFMSQRVSKARAQCFGRR